MKYIRLIAKPNTWYKEGTEVLQEDSNWINRRFTKDEWDKLVAERSCWTVFIGIRIPSEEYVNEMKICGKEPRLDGEVCSFYEFEAFEVDNDGGFSTMTRDELFKILNTNIME